MLSKILSESHPGVTCLGRLRVNLVPSCVFGNSCLMRAFSELLRNTAMVLGVAVIATYSVPIHSQ